MDGGRTFSWAAISPGVSGPCRSSTARTVCCPGVMSSVPRSNRSRREVCRIATRSSAASDAGRQAAADGEVVAKDDREEADGELTDMLLAYLITSANDIWVHAPMLS